METDPDCIHSLADDPEYAGIVKALRSKMDSELKKQKDPRVLGNGDIFDYYPMAREEKLKNMYKEKYYDMFDRFLEKYGRHTVPIPQGWVEPRDGE
jgi:hypothetical protein